MKTKEHIALSTIFVGILFVVTPIPFQGLALIWISSWLIIDSDHYLRHIIKRKKINPKRFLKEGRINYARWKVLGKKQKTKYKYPILIFHGIEALLVLALLSLILSLTKYILIGFVFHLILDYVALYKRQEPILTKLSLIATILYNKNRKSFKIKK